MSEKEAFWRECILLWEDSGLNARQFCRREGLGYQSFLSWKRRFHESADTFVELADSGSSSLILSCGSITLSISPNLSSQDLAQVILSLHQASELCCIYIRLAFTFTVEPLICAKVLMAFTVLFAVISLKPIYPGVFLFLSIGARRT